MHDDDMDSSTPVSWRDPVAEQIRREAWWSGFVTGALAVGATLIATQLAVGILL